MCFKQKTVEELVADKSAGMTAAQKREYWQELKQSIFYLLGGTTDVPSPSDVLRLEAVSYDQETGKLVVDVTRINVPFAKVPKVWPCGIPGSLSMDPVFDKEGMNCYLAGADEAEQKILVDWLADQWLNPPQGEDQKANIIVYQAPDGGLIVHRLYDVKVVDGVRQWRFRGDNVGNPDPWYVGDDSIKYVLACIVY